MDFKAVVFAIIGVLVAAFYGLESALSFQANGVTAPLFVKLAICGAGVYFCFRNAMRVRKGGAGSDSAKATE
ncbi:hypothetical protein [Arenimonas daejeonensis]|uniref:hypothetical protein n=1 Tax=Arenimonas daejeonensis TaxID=370777 RepID=UPI0011BEF1A5|nr:hypothetical protein [Arenimonas daejeonensis]